MLLKLREEGIKVGIITDGRPEGQRNKLAVLGLPELVDDVIITDELGGVQFRKPNDISFRIMQNRWGIPFEQIVYVGDNISKDFIAFYHTLAAYSLMLFHIQTDTTLVGQNINCISLNMKKHKAICGKGMIEGNKVF